MSLLPGVRWTPAVRYCNHQKSNENDEPLRNGTNRQEGMRFPEHQQQASVGPVVAEMRGSLDVVYAKPSVLRRPVFEGRRKATCAAPPDQRIEGTTESRRWATRRQLVSQRRDDAGAIWIDEGRGEGRSASEVQNSGRGIVHRSSR
jgi:hypothetical protein